MPLAWIRVDGERSRVPVTQAPFWLGSGDRADLVAHGPDVLRRHAKLKIRRGEAMLSAADDATILVNGERVPFMTLKNGDVVTLGQDGPRLRYQQRLRLDAVPPDRPLVAAWLRDTAFQSSKGPFAYGEGEALGGRDPSRVRRVEDPEGGRSLVVKVLGSMRGGDDAEHHLRLVSVMSGGPHPNLATVVDGGLVRATGGVYRWLVTRWVEGQTARALVDQGELLSSGRVVAVLQGLSDGLAWLHARGVVHRDVSPANVVLPEGGGASLIDPGHAVLLDAERPSTAGVVGTPGFLAPESVLAGGAPATRAADVYGLAAVGYALLTGRPPASGSDVLESLARATQRPPTPKELGIEAPSSLVTLLFEALASDPRRRPDADAFAQRLEDVAQPGDPA
jgi:serine/threonine-protein kinase